MHILTVATLMLFASNKWVEVESFSVVDVNNVNPAPPLAASRILRNVHELERRRQPTNSARSIASIFRGYSSISSVVGSSSISTEGSDHLDKEEVMKTISKEEESYPSWKDLIELPIKISSRAEFLSKPFSKRVAMVSRISVLHLTLLSCLTPLVFRGTVQSYAVSELRSFSLSSTLVTPIPALIWTIDCMSWHMMHNMLNDFQDLNDDDTNENSFRAAYGLHALKQKTLTKSEFIRIMCLVSIPGILSSALFPLISPALTPALLYGLAAVVLYTPLFKPLGIGELLVYLVWGPFMAGYGALAAGATATNTQLFLKSPITIMLGTIALSVIMGKHTDKINRSNIRTLPKRMGYPTALFACGLSLLAPHACLAWGLTVGRMGSAADGEGVIVPWGAGLAFLTLFRELKWCIRALRKGQASGDGPTLEEEVLVGTVSNVNTKERWPLWFVSLMGWHSITFGYLAVIGCALEWAVRTVFSL